MVIQPLRSQTNIIYFIDNAEIITGLSDEEILISD